MFVCFSKMTSFLFVFFLFFKSIVARHFFDIKAKINPDMFNDESDSQVCYIYLVYNSSSVLDTCCSLTLFILHLSSSSC